MNVWTLTGLGFNAAIILMTLAWFIGRRLKNAGYIEASWPYVFAMVVWLYALLGAAAPIRKLVLALLVTLWAVRLGSYLVKRVARNHETEDLRFRQLREQFPKRPWHMFFGFAQLQAVLIGLFSVPLAMACSYGGASVNTIDTVGVGLWGIGMIGVIMADAQLDRFRTQPENAGQVCDRGLWRYSRHPNYFFEAFIWIAFFLFAVGTPGGWWAIYAPLLMLLLLTKVTGIPATEERALQSRGDAYRAYQQRTSPFIPWISR